MKHKEFWFIYRWIFFALGLFVVIYQCVQIANNQGQSVVLTTEAAGESDPLYYWVKFFSYFTIQSNIIGFIVMGFTGWFILIERQSKTIDIVRLSATTYLTITGLVFHTLLVPFGSFIWDFSVFMQHTLLPLMIIFDWLAAPSGSRIKMRDTLWLLIYPVIYLTYSMVRGAFVHEYPYFFMDPSAISPVMIGVYLLGILGFGLILANLYRLRMPRPVVSS
ncbi:MAG: Pr6Pr family membrane protein [Bifidobacteriaceae bacterium]|jgi:hypothetical protein|nr:Pr6Pr family membrane protein [Bifidobacteriaceae bacterium]